MNELLFNLVYHCRLKVAADKRRLQNYVFAQNGTPTGIHLKESSSGGALNLRIRLDSSSSRALHSLTCADSNSSRPLYLRTRADSSSSGVAIQ